MTRFASRRRAEQFSALVDATVAGPGSGAAGHVDVGAGRRDEATRSEDLEAARLLGVVSQLRSVAQVLEAAQVRPDFRDQLRGRLVAEAVTVLAPPTDAPRPRAEHPTVVPLHPTRARRERRVAVLAAATLLVGGTAGMAGAAQSALPGEALYPVKRGIERLDARLSSSDANRGRDLLHQAATRLDEARRLSVGSAEQVAAVPGTVSAFTSQTREGSELLLDSYRQDRSRAAVADVRSATADGLTSLTELAGSAPAQLRPSLAEAAVALRAVDAIARAACPTCSSLPRLRVPEILLAPASGDRVGGDGNRKRSGEDQTVVAPQDLAGVSPSADGSATTAVTGSAAPTSGPTSGPASAAASGAASSAPSSAAAGLPAPTVRPTTSPTGPTSQPAIPSPPSSSSAEPDPTPPEPSPSVSEVPLPTDGDSGDGLGGISLGGAVGTLLPDAPTPSSIDSP